MKRKRGLKVLDILNSKPVIGILIFLILGLSMAIASDVIVKEGALEVGDNFNASGVLFVNSTVGYVGIGTVSPNDFLEIEGNLAGNGLTIDSTSGAGINIDRAGQGNHYRVIFKTAGTPEWYIGNAAENNGDLIFYEDDTSTPRVTFEEGGNVGIGTDSPNQLLDISGGNIIFDNAKYFYFRNSTGDNDAVGIWRAAGNALRIRYKLNSLIFDALDNKTIIIKDAEDNNRILFNVEGNSYFNGGNVGIGTTTPTADLQIGDASTGKNLGLNVQYLSCYNGAACDEDGSSSIVQDSCPSGYILTGVSNECYDIPSNLEICSSYPVDSDTAASSCKDGASGDCAINGVHFICMRITDIGDA